MPVYAVKCKCGHKEDVFRPFSDHGNWPKHCGSKMKQYLTPTNVMVDMEPYRSPIDGSIVSSRKHHRDHMRKHGVIEVGNEKLTGKKKSYEPEGVRDDIHGVINDMQRRGALNGH